MTKRPNVPAMRSMALLAAWVAFGAAADAKTLALVVGNDAYVNVPKLQKAGGDARSVADKFTKMGFAVRRVGDLDRNAMIRALQAFEDEIQRGDRAIFYFSGHGFEISGTNYILPIDVPAVHMNEANLLRDSSVAVERIIDGIRSRQPAVTIVVLDACRDNPFGGAGSRGVGDGGVGRGLNRVEAPEGVFVLMSAGAKQVALDRLSDSDQALNSVFTRTFLKELDKPGRTLVQVAKATQIGVKDLAARVGYDQRPAYYDEVIGDVVLSESGEVEAEKPLPPPKPPVIIAQAAPPARRAIGETEPVEIAALRVDPQIGQAVKTPGGAPIANFMRSNAGWTVTLSFPVATTEISYRVGQQGEFKETGTLDVLDPRTGRRMPNPSFPLSRDAQAGVIEVRYSDVDGAERGPFAIRFSPETALLGEQKHILQGMPDSWVQFRDFDAKTLVYFTTLVTYRCAISEVRYGFNDGKPLERYDLPACDTRRPFEVPANAKIYMKVPDTTKAINLRITWVDGTESDVVHVTR